MAGIRASQVRDDVLIIFICYRSIMIIVVKKMAQILRSSARPGEIDQFGSKRKKKLILYFVDFFKIRNKSN